MFESAAEDARATHAFSPVRLLIYAGAAGTLILVLKGFGAALARHSQRGLPMSELVVMIPGWVIIGAWVLSPYWGALELQRRQAPTPVVTLVVMILIALGANSFLATSGFVGGKPHPTADGVTIVLIPIVQWVVLGAAGLLLRLGRRARDSK